jgi:aspartyl-tRNA(Asn)/glutamyl-tRNA(Gln) amidotransferase subunit A
MAQNLAASAEILRDSGATVDVVDSPWLEQALAAYAVIVAAEASANLARYDGTHFGSRIDADDHQAMAHRSRSNGFGLEVQLRIMTGVHVLRAGHRDRWHRTARQVRAMVCAALQDHWHEYDALLLPTAAAGAFKLGERTKDSVAMMSADRFTVPANLAGLPAVTVPTAVDEEGLPLSVQLMGPSLSEPTLLALATVIERSCNFDKHRKEAPWQRS